MNRRASRRGRGHRRVDRGSSTVEFVIGAALMVLLLLVVVQTAIYFHLRAAAHTAARHGLDEVRVTNGSVEAGTAATNEFLDQSARTLRDREVTVSRTDETSSVRVVGRIVSVVPGLNLQIDVEVDAPTERTT